jgi:tetratricopeptide (TPR) repeat protein
MSLIFQKNWFWFLLGVIMYINTLGHDYVVDDLIVATKNGLTEKGISGIPEIFSHSYLYGYDGREDESYRPLVLTTFAVERSLFGLNSSASHFVQILLYGLTIMALYKMLKLLFENRSGYFTEWIVLLFAIHPLHSEVVSNVKSRDEILAAMFLFLSLWYFLKWLNDSKSLKYILLAGTTFFVAALSKESVIPAFILFPVIYHLKKGFNFLGMATSSLVSGVPLMNYLFIRSQVLSDVLIADPIDPVANSLVMYEGFDRFLVNSSIFSKYIQLCLFPVQMSWDYSLSTFTLEDAGVSGWIGVMLLISVVAAMAFGTLFRKEWGIGAVLFGTTFIATSNFFFLINCPLGERFMFLPLLGIIILVVCTLSWVGDKLNKPVLLVSIIGLSAYYIPRTFIRNMDWKNNLSIYESGVAVCPGSIKTNFNLGTEYLEQGNKAVVKDVWFDKAIESYQKCLQIYDSYPNVYENLAFVYGEKAKIAQSKEDKLKYLNRANDLLGIAIDSLGLTKRTLFNNRYYTLDELIKLEENSENKLVYLSIMAKTASKVEDLAKDDLHRLIFANYELGKDDDLVKLVENSGGKYSELSAVYLEFSKKYFERKEVGRAIKIMTVYCQMNPGDISSKSNLAMLHEMTGDLDKALVMYEDILKQYPDQVHTLELYNNLKVRMNR